MARSSWRLSRGGDTLAYLRSDGQALVPELDGNFAMEAAFEPLPAFEPVRRLFEREIAIVDSEGDAEHAEWSAIWEELTGPGLFVESFDGRDRWDILWIHIQNGRAWWWPLGSSPKTVLDGRKPAEPDAPAAGGGMQRFQDS